MFMSQDERDFHRKIAAKCFNETWNYLDKPVRDASGDRQMLLLTHTSRYHWSFVGDATSCMAGDWQISRVYAALKQPELAMQFASTALEICQAEKLSDLSTSAYEGMARAYAIENDLKNAKKYINLARKALESIVDKEDRRIYTDQIDETEAMIDQLRSRFERAVDH